MAQKPILTSSFHVALDLPIPGIIIFRRARERLTPSIAAFNVQQKGNCESAVIRDPGLPSTNEIMVQKDIHGLVSVK
jgi:hypothetical protein